MANSAAKVHAETVIPAWEAQMTQLAVIRQADAWQVFVDGKRTIECGSRMTAVSAGLRLAGTLQRRGDAVQVLLQDDAGELIAIGGGEAAALSRVIRGDKHH